jgi:hypothetical protein
MGQPLLLDMVQFLVNNSIVQEDGVDAFRDFTPEAPDTLIALHEYRGDPGVQHESAVNRSVQILSRSKSANEARQRALDIHSLLISDNLIINFTPDRWGQVHIRQSPFKIGIDGNGRTTYGFNVGITTTTE